MSDFLSQGVESQDRSLTSQEIEPIFWLLENGDPAHRSLSVQLQHLSVAGKCNCGCPTIYFALDGEPVGRKGEQIISDFLANVGGAMFGVMLFQTDGKPSSLEVYSCAGIDEPFGLPAIDSIYPFEDRGQHRPSSE
jgi:hypothetical protein